MSDFNNHINQYLSNSANTIETIKKLNNQIIDSFELIKSTIEKKNKILIAGNGGLAAEAEHFCGELTCTFKSPKRRAISAISLTSSASAITAWANDFGFDSYFSRMVESLGSTGDVLFLMSTSGGDIENNFSLNLYEASKIAKKNGIKVISIVGKKGGALSETSDIFLHIESNITSHIQEATLVTCHLICDLLDQAYAE